IQVPATVLSPLHTASGPSPPTTSGANKDTINTARGPPNITPTDPVIKSKPAFFLSFHISFRSRLSVKSTKLTGSKYREAIVYKDESAPEIIFREFNTPGKK